MAPIKSQNSNMLLAFLTLLGVIAIVAVVGFFMLRKGPEIIQGQAEVTEYRVSSKVPGRILEFRVKEGQSVNAGDTLTILEAPDVVAKMEQARAAEAAAQAQNAKAIKGAREEQIQAAYEMWQKAQAGVTIAEKSYQRIKNLYEQGVMPAQKLDEVTAQRDASIATEKAAKAQYTMAKNGAEREDKMKRGSFGKPSKRCCCRSRIVHKGDLSHSSGCRRSFRDFPEGRRIGRYWCSHHEYRRAQRYVGNIQRTRGSAQKSDNGFGIRSSHSCSG